MRALACAVVLMGCAMRVETASQPVAYRLSLTDTCGDSVVVERYDGSAYQPVDPADVVIPSMQGGYTDRGGERSNVHDPDTYRVVRIRQRDRVLYDLSIDELNALPRDAEQRAIVRVRCG
jgi:hypothetical protein